MAKLSKLIAKEIAKEMIPCPDPSSNFKASTTDAIDSCINSIDDKISDVKTDICKVKVGVDVIESFYEGLILRINQVTSCLPSHSTSLPVLGNAC
jgi:hypothetical protein